MNWRVATPEKWDVVTRKSTGDTELVQKVRLRFDAVAENVADAESPDETHQALMNSPPHRENILNPQYRLTGIAVAQNPLTAVVLFADRCE